MARLIGYNTDGMGYMRAVQDAGYDLIGKTLTIMGAGGAATAICAQAALDGVKDIHIFARKTSRFWDRTRRLVDNINHNLPCNAYLHENQDQQALKICHFKKLPAFKCHIPWYGSKYRECYHHRYLHIP